MTKSSLLPKIKHYYTKISGLNSVRVGNNTYLEKEEILQSDGTTKSWFLFQGQTTSEETRNS